MAKSNADLFLFQMLKGGVDKRTRDMMGMSMAHSLTRALKLPPPPALSPADQEIVQRLERTGFAPIDPMFPAQELDEIHRYFADKPISFNTNDSSTGFVVRGFAADRPPELRFGNWDQTVISGCPAFCRVAHDPKLLQIAEAYLKAPPTIAILTAWWTYPSNAAPGGMQHFHHDRDDFRMLKVFAYLTDTTETSGPHEFVEETHSFDTLMAFMGRRTWLNARQQKEFVQWMEVHRKDDQEVARYFPENVRTITGTRGTSFFEDTRGLHRGLPPVTAPRLAFEILYALSPKLNTLYTPIPRTCAVNPMDSMGTYATRLFYSDPHRA